MASAPATWWQYINENMPLDLSSKPSIAGVGLVLDTRQKDAKSAVRAIEREMSEIQGQADRAGGQELQEVGASQNPKLKELQDRLGKALVELQASKEEDGIVVSRQHKDGSAFKSGRISNGDILAKVDGTAIGQ